MNEQPKRVGQPPSADLLNKAVRVSLGDQRIHEFRMNCAGGFALLEGALDECINAPWLMRFLFKRKLNCIIKKIDHAHQMFRKA